MADREYLQRGLDEGATAVAGRPTPAWSRNLLCLWEHRRLLLRVGLVSMVLSTVVAFLLPERFESSTTIMPPEQTNSGAAMLAALAGRGGGSGGGAALGSIAGGLLGVRSNGDLLIDLLHSGSVEGGLIEDFHLQQVYGNRYVEDTAKRLTARTEISESKKSGVITIVVTDTDRGRAQGMARDYVERLNRLLAQVSTSSARRERMFIEQRLAAVTSELTAAQEDLSKFSSKTSTVDLKEQTRAEVDAGAKLQAQLIVAESEMSSLEQIYGDDNVRVKAARERVAVLRREVGKIGGSAETADDSPASAGELYPSLRQLPALGVRYADLYRRVKVQETVFEMLSAQYETARIQEAKELPVVSVIDAAGWPERKSFPHRSRVILGGMALWLIPASLWLLLRRRWQEMDDADDLKIFVRTVRADRAAPHGAGAKHEEVHS
jgi:uncharacterized protein involved in exopolysaccharide biosynthesis